ncbi:MAG: hypothetical protein P8X74_08885 [Reinekea sp.]|jgi:hypothetical protein
MSDLTAEQWSRKTIAQLHDYERECPDIELFCVGYLIPPVELLETENGQCRTSALDWHQLYVDFVEQCMQQDQVAEDDQQRIRNIMAGLL